MFRSLLSARLGGTAPWRWTLCAACGQGAASRLCADCLARHGSLGPACRRCALPTGSEVAACGHCSAESPAFEAAVAALPFAFPWDGLLRRLKYHEATDLAPALAGRLAAQVHAAQRSGRLQAVELVLPVPLAEGRLRERGFNQAWELAHRVAATLGTPARSDLLVRRHDTVAQARLGRQARLRNLRDAFAVAPGASARLSGRSVALVDDVMTTGATADACASTLLQAGAAAVQVWVVARTPPPAGSSN